MGAAHGFIIASLFFILMIWGAGRAIGGISRGIANLGYEAGLSVQELNPSQPDQSQLSAKELAEKAATAVTDAGWSLFVTFLVGLIGAVIGGRVGAKANYDRPFALREKAV